MKKVIICLVLLAVICGLVFAVIKINKNNKDTESVINEENVFAVEYFDNYIPGATYNIALNKDKVLYVTVNRASSVLNEDDELEDGSVEESMFTLNDEEYDNVINLYNKMNFDNENYGRTFCSALAALVRGEAVLTDNTLEDYDSNEDLNADGTVTWREYGNIRVNELIDRIDQEAA